MRARRFGRLPLTLALIGVIAVGGPLLAAPHTDALATSDSSAVVRGVIHAVDATIVDSADTRGGRADRQAPRHHDLPLPLTPMTCVIALALVGVVGDRALGPAAIRRLRNSIGRRAPPSFAAR